MKPLDEPEQDDVEVEQYGAGWIQQSWLWACDDCLHEAVDGEDDDSVSASCGSCDTVHEARQALMEHNVSRHGGRAFA